MNIRPLALMAIAVVMALVIIGFPYVAPDLLTSSSGTSEREVGTAVPAEAPEAPSTTDTSRQSAETANPSSPDAIEAASPASKERLIAIPPTDWQTVYQLNTDASRMVEMIPGNESDDSWQTRLTFESNRELAQFDPITLLDGESNDLHTRCEFVRWYPVFSDYENGYPTSVRMFMCGKHRRTGRGEVSLFKIIQGDDYLYSIRFQRRVAAFELNEPELADSEIADFSDYLRRVIVCNGEPEHPCPGGPVISEG
ncbi:MAG: hypothetical protein AAF525_03145 [Pseudomonadota bacterium]